MKQSTVFAFLFSLALHTYSQDSTKRHLPIIDVHVHAMKVNPAFGGDMCPWFLSSMPGSDPNDKASPFGFVNTDCATPLHAARSDKEFQDSLMATMRRLNMTIVVSGDASVIRSWHEIGRLAAIAGVRTFLNYFLDRDITTVAERVRAGEGAASV